MNNDNLSELAKTFKQFKPAKGKQLNHIGKLYGIERGFKKFLFFKIKESDKKYRQRISDNIKKYKGE